MHIAPTQHADIITYKGRIHTPQLVACAMHKIIAPDAIIMRINDDSSLWDAGIISISRNDLDEEYLQSGIVDRVVTHMLKGDNTFVAQSLINRLTPIFLCHNGHKLERGAVPDIVNMIATIAAFNYDDVVFNQCVDIIKLYIESYIKQMETDANVNDYMKSLTQLKSQYYDYLVLRMYVPPARIEKLLPLVRSIVFKDGYSDDWRGVILKTRDELRLPVPTWARGLRNSEMESILGVPGLTTGFVHRDGWCVGASSKDDVIGIIERLIDIDEEAS